MSQRVRLADLVVVVHRTPAAVRTLRGLTVPGDIVGHAAQIVPAVSETATVIVLDLDLAALVRPIGGASLGDEERAMRPAPAGTCQHERRVG